MEQKNYFVHESSYVDEPADIGEGTKIWHFSHIMQNCKIGKNVTIIDSIIWDNVSIADNVTIKDSVIASGCKIEADTDNLILGANHFFCGNKVEINA